jgi:hypothetical protein
MARNPLRVRILKNPPGYGQGNPDRPSLVGKEGRITGRYPYDDRKVWVRPTRIRLIGNPEFPMRWEDIDAV